MLLSRYLPTALLSLAVFIGPQSSFAVESEIPKADNLGEIGRMSLQQGIPAVVFVSRDACPYCRTLSDRILKPMLAAGKFEGRAILVEVSLDRVEPISGFGNQQMTAQSFGDAYKATITPTLLFLDSEGDEIGRRIIGISNLELYGHYLQKSIDAALLALSEEAP